MEVEKVAKIAMLYDFYGQLLTEKQQELVELYYNDNLSLGEIAQEYGVSRQAVHDLIKRAEKILLDYEEKLSLVEKYTKERLVLAQVKTLLDQISEKSPDANLAPVNKLLNQLLD